jgi:glycosyltransferase involved in cell wall biosynthesis
MTKKLTVTVGIPAYNEEANIKRLLQALIAQKQINYILERIIVISDKSNDNTDLEVESLRNKKIILLRNRKRLGKSLSQNVILRNNKSQVLVIFDADTLPKDKYLLENLIKLFSKENNVGLVGGSVEPMSATTLTEKILYDSVQAKNYIYRKFNKGNNIYLCHGRVRAFSENFIKSLKWRKTYGEDAYSYLSCLSEGFEFYYMPSAEVIYKLPSSLKDHLKQSVRFMNSKNEMMKYFKKELVESSYKIPFYLKIEASIRFFFRNPLRFCIYLGVYCYAKYFGNLIKYNKAVWESSPSSKNLVATQ